MSEYIGIMYKHMYTHTYLHMHTRTHTHIHIHTHTYTTNAYIHTYMHSCMHVGYSKDYKKLIAAYKDAVNKIEQPLLEVWLCVSAVYLAVCVCCVCAGIQRR